MKVGVASSSTIRWVGGHLERLAFREIFDAVTCREEGMRAKPAPDIYLAATGSLGVAPGEAIAVEDSRNGIAAAKAAGLRCIAVPNELTSEQDLSAADLRLRSLAEMRLDAILARLGFAA
jgi:beta-phosphoglucomutase-like phosphatase (HAD superfamily)